MGCVWIGMVEVSIGPDCTLDFLEGVGAFVWYAAQADSEEMFIKKVGETVTGYGLIPIEFENIRPVDDVMELDEELFEIVTRAEESADFAIYGTFHTFPHHES